LCDSERGVRSGTAPFNPVRRDPRADDTRVRERAETSTALAESTGPASRTGLSATTDAEKTTIPPVKTALSTTKLLTVALMIVGRPEVLPVLVLLTRSYWQS